MSAGVFTSCNKSGEDLIVGTWRHDYYYEGDYFLTVFNANHTGAQMEYENGELIRTSSFTYSLQDDILKIAWDFDGEIMENTYSIITLTNETLIFMEWMDEDFWTFYRV
jgi:hypothetical protein